MNSTFETLRIGVNYAPSLVNALLSSVVGSVVDMKVAMAHEANGDFGNAWLKTNSAGSGAYVLKSWTPNDRSGGSRSRTRIIARGVAKLARVVIRHVPEASAQRLLLEKGDVDVAENLTPDQVTAVSGNKDIKITTGARTRPCFITSAST